MLKDTGWICPQCGHFNTRRSKCEKCGNTYLAADEKDQNPIWNRVRMVSVEMVVRVLDLIATQPNRRKRPRKGDVSGDFSVWFDGGAVRHVTGFSEFVFSDGTQAWIHVRPFLSIRIELPNGEHVVIQQEPRQDVMSEVKEPTHLPPASDPPTRHLFPNILDLLRVIPFVRFGDRSRH